MLYLLVWNSASELFFYLINVLEFLFILSGLMVIISKNPIISILYLIALFLLVSAYLIIIGVHFIGISYLLVYIGAVSILFLFILMLIDIRISELHVETMNNTVLATVLGILLLIPLLFTKGMTGDFNILNAYTKMFSGSHTIRALPDRSINYIFNNTWEGYLIENSDISVIGNILYTNFSLWLILSLLILLLAMVGAIVINLDIKAKNNG